jgi:phosphinothricin acetyltransferase
MVMRNPGEKYQIREARLEDLPAIVAIYNVTIPSRMVTADTAPVSIESRIEWFHQHGHVQRRPLWVAENSGQIAGWLSYSSFYGRPAYNITAELSVYIAESHRRIGLGSHLLNQAITNAPSLGINNLLGFIFGHNLPSLDLFRKFGFVNWALLPGVAVLDGEERDLVILGKKLSGQGRPQHIP